MNISKALSRNGVLSYTLTPELNAISQRRATDRYNLAASSFSFLARG